LAHLQLGRAFVLQGNVAKARAAYKDFLTLWKDADCDIPVLQQAKAECAREAGVALSPLSKMSALAPSPRDNQPF
jgi:hypothetical protein